MKEKLQIDMHVRIETSNHWFEARESELGEIYLPMK